ncbi:hypothetical protein, partial [Stutzerimonas stutzeri]|uniref:hypothetical protein n=1 Tax=Stutzerimonas stutzeri TaxID=316 RepID=UPI001C8B360F
ICFMGKLGEVKSGDFAKSGSLFQTFPKVDHGHARRDFHRQRNREIRIGDLVANYAIGCLDMAHEQNGGQQRGGI